MRHVQYHPYYCAEAKIDAEGFPGFTPKED
jgi:hypothetical protein